MKRLISLLGIVLLSIVPALGLLVACDGSPNEPKAQDPQPSRAPANCRKVSGELTRTEQWSGTVCVQGDVYVPQTVTLTISPGTTVYFANLQDSVKKSKNLLNYPDARAELIVDGTLRAQGTRTKPITFTSDRKQPQPGDWGGIYLGKRATSVTLRYLIVEYANVNLAIYNNSTVELSVFRYAHGAHGSEHFDVREGLRLAGPKAIVRYSIIYSNTWGIHSNGGQGQLIENNWVFDNKRTASGHDKPNGIHVYDSDIRIQSNLIAHNTWGVEIGGNKLVTLTGNTICFNNERGLDLNDNSKKPTLRDNVWLDNKEDRHGFD